MTGRNYVLKRQIKIYMRIKLISRKTFSGSFHENPAGSLVNRNNTSRTWIRKLQNLNIFKNHPQDPLRDESDLFRSQQIQKYQNK